MRTRVVKEKSIFFSFPAYTVEYYDENYGSWFYADNSYTFSKAKAESMAKNMAKTGNLKEIISKYGED